MDCQVRRGGMSRYIYYALCPSPSFARDLPRSPRVRDAPRPDAFASSSACLRSLPLAPFTEPNTRSTRHERYLRRVSRLACRACGRTAPFAIVARASCYSVVAAFPRGSSATEHTRTLPRYCTRARRTLRSSTPLLAGYALTSVIPTRAVNVRDVRGQSLRSGVPYGAARGSLALCPSCAVDKLHRVLFALRCPGVIHTHDFIEKLVSNACHATLLSVSINLFSFTGNNV